MLPVFPLPPGIHPQYIEKGYGAANNTYPIGSKPGICQHRHWAAVRDIRFEAGSERGKSSKKNPLQKAAGG